MLLLVVAVQVFGSLLSTKADKKEDETDNGEKEEKDQQVKISFL